MVPSSSEAEALADGDVDCPSWENEVTGVCLTRGALRPWPSPACFWWTAFPPWWLCCTSCIWVTGGQKPWDREVPRMNPMLSSGDIRDPFKVPVRLQLNTPPFHEIKVPVRLQRNTPPFHEIKCGLREKAVSLAFPFSVSGEDCLKSHRVWDFLHCSTPRL